MIMIFERRERLTLAPHRTTYPSPGDATVRVTSRVYSCTPPLSALPVGKTSSTLSFKAVPSAEGKSELDTKWAYDFEIKRDVIAATLSVFKIKNGQWSLRFIAMTTEAGSQRADWPVTLGCFYTGERVAPQGKVATASACAMHAPCCLGPTLASLALAGLQATETAPPPSPRSARAPRKSSSLARWVETANVHAAQSHLRPRAGFLRVCRAALPHLAHSRSRKHCVRRPALPAFATSSASTPGAPIRGRSSPRTPSWASARATSSGARAAWVAPRPCPRSRGARWFEDRAWR